MLDRLQPNPGSRKRRRRVGRGASGRGGRTAGRGQKGAGARTGTTRRPGYEGGQNPLGRRIPKFGFTNLFRETYQVVNVRDLGRVEGDLVSRETCAACGLVRHVDRPVKLLGFGELSRALRVELDATSASARRKIEAAGGSVQASGAEAPRAVRRSRAKSPGGAPRS